MPDALQILITIVIACAAILAIATIGIVGDRLVCDGRLSLRFLWYDMWIGVYYDRLSRAFYICPVPMVCIYYARGSSPRNPS